MAKLTVTCVGGSCCLLDFGGRVVVTDPDFSKKKLRLLDNLSVCGIFAGFGPESGLKPLFGRVDPATPVVVAPGRAEKASQAGFEVVLALEPGQSADLGPVSCTAAPAMPGERITGVFTKGKTGVFFGSDSLFAPELARIKDQFPNLRAAILPVGDKGLVRKKRRMSPQEAAGLCTVLGPKKVALLFAEKAPALERDFALAAAILAPGTRVFRALPGQPLDLVG